MSGIPYNELQPIKITAKDDSGETAVLETLFFSLVIPCRDCKHFKAETKKHPALCRLWLPRNLSRQYGIEPDGFCAWGERRWTTCKCGEEIELGGREDAVCPSCGRTVRE